MDIFAFSLCVCVCVCVCVRLCVCVCVGVSDIIVYFNDLSLAAVSVITSYDLRQCKGIKVNLGII